MKVIQQSAYSISSEKRENKKIVREKSRVKKRMGEFCIIIVSTGYMGRITGVCLL